MRTAAVLIVVLALVPVVSSAQAASELQAQITALLAQIRSLQERIAAGGTAPASPAAGTCPVLSRALSIGARGDDVTQLQLFLKAKGYFNEEATGYFGTITEAALKKFQASNNVVSSGDAASTGYGAVGPKTRAAIAKACGTAAPGTAVVTAPAVQQCAAATSPVAPSASCAGQWEKLTNLGCHIGWRCSVASNGANKSPVVSGIDGPASLAVDSFGAWKVQAVDPEGGALTYRVIWGDEGYEDILNAIAGLGGTYVSSPNLTHSYAKAGAYPVEVAVRDSAGNVTNATFSVKVGASGTGVSVGTYTNPVAPTGTGTGASCVTPWGSQVVVSSSTIAWQPFFTEGTYFATSSPLMRCDNGAWKKCDAAGNSCQDYIHATSTPSTAALPSYTTTIGDQCSPEGSIREVSVPPGTQLCQWLNCRVTTVVETIKVKCTHSGWTDYANY